MRHIQGNTPKEQLLSVDGILQGILKKQLLLEHQLTKKKKYEVPFNVSGYAEACTSGDIICACLSLFEMQIKKAVIVIEDYPKDTDLNAVITIVSDKDVNESINVPIKQGINSIDIEKRIKKGDKISVFLKFPDISPQGIWVAMRGDYI